MAQLLSRVFPWSCHLGPVGCKPVSDKHDYWWPCPWTGVQIPKKGVIVGRAETADSIDEGIGGDRILGLLSWGPRTPSEAVTVVVKEIHSPSTY